jgi:hypothetical protein
MTRAADDAVADGATADDARRWCEVSRPLAGFTGRGYSVARGNHLESDVPARDTIIHRFLAQGVSRPAAPAYFTKQGGVWRPTTWRDYVVEVRTAARALIALGFPAGGRSPSSGSTAPSG